MTKPRTYVDAPSFTPLPYGLLSTMADVIRRPSDSHWQFGVNYQPVCAEGATTFGDCFAVSGTGLAPVGEPPSKVATASVGLRGATSFTVYSEVDCSPVGFWDDATNIIGNTFTQSEQWQVENALWTGVAGGQLVVFPHLAEDTAVVDEFGVTLQTAATAVSGLSTPLDIVEGLGQLEKALADCYDGVGTIHAPRDLIAPMAEANLIVQEGPRYRTMGGNIVVFGAGYRGTSPSGTSASGQTWMYATGAMFIYQSDVQVFQKRDSLDRSDNTLKAIAERTYVLGWDCCHLAVNISTGGIATGAVAAPN